MRMVLVMGAAALVLAGGMETAEARGRGFGRLFSSRTVATPRPSIAMTPVLVPTVSIPVRTGATASPRFGVGVGVGVGLGVAAGAVTRLAANEPGASAAGSLIDRPQPAPAPVAQARFPTCPADRLVGGGFCLLN